MLFSADAMGNTLDPFPGCSLVIALLRPESRGTVMITSPDPTVHPAIQPNYLSEIKDRETLILGLRKGREIMAQPAIRHYIVEEHRPGPDCASDEDLLAYLEEHGRISFHPVGTCRMGSDERGGGRSATQGQRGSGITDRGRFDHANSGIR